MKGIVAMVQPTAVHYSLTVKIIEKNKNNNGARCLILARYATDTAVPIAQTETQFDTSVGAFCAANSAECTSIGMKTYSYDFGETLMVITVNNCITNW